MWKLTESGNLREYRTNVPRQTTSTMYELKYLLHMPEIDESNFICFFSNHSERDKRERERERF